MLGPTAFVQVARTVIGDSSYLSHPLLDGNPRALLLATPNWNPGGSAGVYTSAPVGVWFDEATKQWAVFTQTRSPLPTGSAFNLEALAPDDGSFFHIGSAKTIAGNSTYLDHALLNGQPAAQMQVTPLWNPPGETGVYNPHAIGVWYDTDQGRWAVFNQDQAAMPEGSGFSVVVER